MRIHTGEKPYGYLTNTQHHVESAEARARRLAGDREISRLCALGHGWLLQETLMVFSVNEKKPISNILPLAHAFLFYVEGLGLLLNTKLVKERA